MHNQLEYENNKKIFVVDETKRLTGVDEFTIARQHFEAHGVYTNLFPGSAKWLEFWREEKRRCIEGYNIGRDAITGYHYFYLNYSPIIKVAYSGDVEVGTGQIQGSRIEGFPDFWDSDYDYFWYLEEAEKSGSHATVLKTRGRGYSFKGGSMLCRNFFLIPRSKSYAVASEMEFLTKDGLLSKAWENMAFVNDHTAWYKAREKKDTDVHKRASYIDSSSGRVVEKGYLSEIIGISLKDKPNKIRGKRGKLILFEEGGQFPGLLQSWQIATPGMQAGRVTFGLMCAYGTGGSKDADYSGLEELFYKPKGYNVLQCRNIWDVGMEDTTCGFFVPEYRNAEGFMDKNGNSLIDLAKQNDAIQRENIKLNSKDPDALLRYIAERPHLPAEAMLRLSGSVFPQGELAAWETKLSTMPNLKLLTEASAGKLYHADGGIKFKPDLDLKPITEFPLKKGSDKTGAVVVYQTPYKLEGIIPDNMYFLCCDPYGIQTDGGESLGACYVIKRINPYSRPDDMIVASYVGRPEFMDEFNRQVFMLAEYYNAKIAFENDRGDIIPYARSHKKLHWLIEEPELYDTSGNKFRKLGRGYGISMSSIERKKTAALYLRDWLLTERSETENGEKILNLHYIYDLGLVRELRKYSFDGNFDRVSSLLCGMFYRQDLMTREMRIDKPDDKDEFFNRDFFN